MVVDDRKKRSAEADGPKGAMGEAQPAVEPAPLRASDPDLRAAREIVHEHIRTQMEEAAKWLTD
jgi:hypothetical protein